MSIPAITLPAPRRRTAAKSVKTTRAKPTTMEAESHGSGGKLPNGRNPQSIAAPLGTRKYGKIEMPPNRPCAALCVNW